MNNRSEAEKRKLQRKQEQRRAAKLRFNEKLNAIGIRLKLQACKQDGLLSVNFLSFGNKLLGLKDLRTLLYVSMATYKAAKYHIEHVVHRERNRKIYTNVFQTFTLPDESSELHEYRSVQVQRLFTIELWNNVEIIKEKFRIKAVFTNNNGSITNRTAYKGTVVARVDGAFVVVYDDMDIRYEKKSWIYLKQFANNEDGSYKNEPICDDGMNAV
jgi:hypothetical protein